MTASNFARCCALTLRHEGGWSDHPSDPGGATNLGVTIGTLSSWLGRKATKADVRALTKETVAPIYRKNFWDKIRGDELPAGVDYVVYDFAVNSGPKRGAMALQRVVGVADDGVIGSETLAHVAMIPVEEIIRRICSDRMAFLRRLTTWPTFGKGWSTRVNGVLAEALAMARAAPMPIPPVEVAPLDPPPSAGPVFAPAARNSGSDAAQRNYGIPPRPEPAPPLVSPTNPGPAIAKTTGWFAGLLGRLRTAYPPKKD